METERPIEIQIFTKTPPVGEPEPPEPQPLERFAVFFMQDGTKYWCPLELVEEAE